MLDKLLNRDLREVLVAYNRAALMLGDDKKLKKIFLRYQGDEIFQIFNKFGDRIGHIVDGPPFRPSYVIALRELWIFGMANNLIRSE